MTSSCTSFSNSQPLLQSNEQTNSAHTPSKKNKLRLSFILSSSNPSSPFLNKELTGPEESGSLNGRITYEKPSRALEEQANLEQTSSSDEQDEGDKIRTAVKRKEAPNELTSSSKKRRLQQATTSSRPSRNWTEVQTHLLVKFYIEKKLRSSFKIMQ